MTVWLTDRIWYRKYSVIAWLLFPLSLVFVLVSVLRRLILKAYFQKKTEVPVIVVGNISVGGTGKTPLVIAIAEACVSRGLRVGIVSRGYGAQQNVFPYQVKLDDSADAVGDEPLLIARRTRCPVVIAPKRSEAVAYLLREYTCDLILSDDGLQHYAMGRALEIIVLDGTRGLGNGLCLPAGPLRETAHRLKTVDFIVVNQGHRTGAYAMTLSPDSVVQLSTGHRISSHRLQQPVAAIAAIGHPQRFFKTLEGLQIQYHPYIFPDHYKFQPRDFEFSQKSILMTEKDAVKCQAFTQENMYYVPVTANIDDAFWQAFWSHKALKGLLKQ